MIQVHHVTNSFKTLAAVACVMVGRILEDLGMQTRFGKHFMHVLGGVSIARAGFQPVMPDFDGQINDTQLTDLVDYIKSLAQPQ